MSHAETVDSPHSPVAAESPSHNSVDMDTAEQTLLLDLERDFLMTESLQCADLDGDGASFTEPDPPVGSAVAVARNRRRSTGDIDRSHETLLEFKEDIVEAKPKNNVNKKIIDHLRKMMLSKKEKDDEAIAKERRSSKRAQIISVRVFNEAAERKNMSRHDKHMNGVVTVPTAVVVAKPVLKITPELSNSIYARLVARQSKSLENAELLAKVTSISVREYTEWKLKHSIPQHQRVFTISGWYPCVKEALVQRGWYFNSDYSSSYFDLKWSNKTMDIEHDVLQPWQLTNHFTNNVTMTTKAGLIRSLESLKWTSDMVSNDILPRAYDLSIADEVEEFVSDFQCQRAEGVLKSAYFRQTGVTYFAACEEACSTSHQSDMCSACSPPLPPCDRAIEVFVNKAVFHVACSMLERYARSLDVNAIDNVAAEPCAVLSRVDWEVLALDAFKTHTLPAVPPEMELLTSKKISSSTACSAQEVRRASAMQRQQESYRSSLVEEALLLIKIDDEALARVHSILLQMHAISGKQTRINGDFGTCKNIWIVKPAAKSRGRGICVFTDLAKLLKYVDVGTTISAQNMWVVQKYIENPLVIADRKFDLRQWVLVTDWNPLTIYLYGEFYTRFSVEKYSSDEGHLENVFVHLVNNSIGKNSENFYDVITAENGVDVEGFMWDFNRFSSYLEQKTGKADFVNEMILPKMREIIINSLSCGCDSVTARKNSWELYGFDFMIDDSYKTWLIEINSSPACDYSTKTAEAYVKKALVEILSVVIDVGEWEKKDRESRGVRPDTGGWACIHRGPTLEVPVSSFGSDMGVKGSAMKVPPKKTILRTFGSVDKSVAAVLKSDSTRTFAVPEKRLSIRLSARTRPDDASKQAITSVNDSDSEDSDDAIETIAMKDVKERRSSSVKETKTPVARTQSRVVGVQSSAIPIKIFAMEF